jgi:hypothetical protein
MKTPLTHIADSGTKTFCGMDVMKITAWPQGGAKNATCRDCRIGYAKTTINKGQRPESD